MKKNIYFLYLLNEKNGIHSIYQDKVPEIRDFLLIIIGWGESDKVILQVSIAVFRALLKNFSGKNSSAPLEKIGPYAYGTMC